jgi:hypothetical protein
MSEETDGERKVDLEERTPRFVIRHWSFGIVLTTAS